MKSVTFVSFYFVSRVKVREGRRAANFPELCGFLDYTAISEDI